MTKDKIYIGELECLEILQGFGIFELPKIGKEWLNVPAIATGKTPTAIGKDKHGYYLYEYNYEK